MCTFITREKSNTIGANDEKVVAVPNSNKPNVKRVDKVQSPIRQRTTLQYVAQRSSKSAGDKNDRNFDAVLADNQKDVENKFCF